MGTLIDHVETEVDLHADGARLRVSPGDLEAATGWVLKPEGLCRGDVCVPVRDRAALVDDAGRIDLAAFASALGRVSAIDAAAGVAVLGDGAAGRRQALESLEAPDVALTGLAGEPRHLSEWSGQKRAIVAWASWCGCRYELPAWQALRAELAPKGFEIVSISMDDDVDAALPWVEAAEPHPEFPVLVDPDHRIAEAYGIVNVPSVVWIDEHDRVVRPPVIAPGDDQFIEFTKIEADVHHDQLRAWVNDGELPYAPDEAREHVEPPTEELQQARVERRLAAWLHRHGDDEAAAAHFERAVELAPLDFTIVRGSMPLRGDSPFGERFFEFWERWQDAGRPGYGSAEARAAE
jgi:peroxiredoxin